MAGEHIIIFEQHNDMTELVASRLSRHAYEVDITADSAEGLKLARTLRPDLLVLDATLSAPAGRAALMQVRSDPATADIPVLVLSGDEEEGDAAAGQWVGADEHVAKPFSMSAVVGRVGAMLRPGEWRPPRSAGQLTAGAIRLDRATYRVEVGGRDVSLTLTEFRLLAVIVEAGGKALTREELICEAIGDDAVVSRRTIDVHMAALRRKLGKARRHIETVRGVGYRLGRADHRPE